MKQALTDTAIKNAKPKDKDYRLTDGQGLYILIKPNGAKWWRFDYSFEGKRLTLSLGVYPQVSLVGNVSFNFRGFYMSAVQPYGCRERK